MSVINNLPSLGGEIQTETAQGARSYTGSITAEKMGNLGILHISINNVSLTRSAYTTVATFSNITPKTACSFVLFHDNTYMLWDMTTAGVVRAFVYGGSGSITTSNWVNITAPFFC